MVKIKRLPLPDPFTADEAVTQLYLAWTNGGRVHPQAIFLRNPAMVEAIIALWRSTQQGNLPADTIARGTIHHVGRWSLFRADGEQGGWIHIQYASDTQQE